MINISQEKHWVIDGDCLLWMALWKDEKNTQSVGWSDTQCFVCAAQCGQYTQIQWMIDWQTQQAYCPWINNMLSFKHRAIYKLTQTHTAGCVHELSCASTQSLQYFFSSFKYRHNWHEINLYSQKEDMDVYCATPWLTTHTLFIWLCL